MSPVEAALFDVRRQLSDLRRALGERQDAGALLVRRLPEQVETVLADAPSITALRARLDVLEAAVERLAAASPGSGSAPAGLEAKIGELEGRLARQEVRFGLFWNVAPVRLMRGLYLRLSAWRHGRAG